MQQQHGFGRNWLGYSALVGLGVVTILTSVLPVSGADLILNNQSVTLGGVQTYGIVSLTNGSRIFVPAYNGSDHSNTGNLVLKADTITIDASSSVIAKGVGYQGGVCRDGAGPATTPLAGGRGGCGVRDSAGGGAHLGSGGRGTKDLPASFPAGYEEDCVGAVNAGACLSRTDCRNNDGLPTVAGQSYQHSTYAAEFGAAGGDKGCRDNDGFTPSAGTTVAQAAGNGGGRIVLFSGNAAQSGQLTINGIVNANGNRGCANGNDSAGGGAGGSVLLVGDSVTVGATARISAAGGRGGDSQPKCLSCAVDADCGGSGQTCVSGRCSPCNCTPCSSSAQCNAALGQTCKNLGGAFGHVCADATNQCTPVAAGYEEAECTGTQNSGTCDDCGGGGGGGLVEVQSRSASINPLATFDVGGAYGGICPICTGEAGGGAGSVQTNGTYVGEVCDGYDNDFNGLVDDGLAPLNCQGASLPACVNGVVQHCPVTHQTTGIVVDPGTPTKLYAGFDGDGVYRSGDGGASWLPPTAPGNPRVMGLVMHPGNHDLLFAATYGGGISTSLDGGEHWLACANTGLSGEGLYARALAMDPAGRLYAGTEGGVYRSLTAADCSAWQATGVLPGIAEVLAVDPLDAQRLYAGIDGSGVSWSGNAGNSWTAAATFPAANQRVKALLITPGDRTKLFAATYGNGVYQSGNSGQDWSTCANTNLTNLNVISLAIDNYGRLYAGTEAGVFVSSDNCEHWTEKNGFSLLCYVDADGDGYGIIAGTTVASPDLQCLAVDHESLTRNDCDDSNAVINPGATEICDGIDNDCNSVVDDAGAVSGLACNTGLFGICAAGTTSCVSGQAQCGQTFLPTTEVLGNGLDDDCDNAIDENDNADVDGDGWSPADGDCCDSSGPCSATPALVNPGAFEVIGNGVDDDCDPATSDTVPVAACSPAGMFSGVTATDLALAMDICQSTTANPPPAQKKWGLISATQLFADGSTPNVGQLANLQNYQSAVLSNYGTMVTPGKGPTMGGLSTGRMRDANDVGFVNPNSGSSFGVTGNPPALFLAAHGNALPAAQSCNGTCNAGAGANDSVNVRLAIRVPTNARSFSYRFKFHSADFPEYLCQPYNDFYLALLTTGEAGIPADRNISVDDLNNPMSVNNHFVDVCQPSGCVACPSGTMELTGTGMEGGGGAATQWLRTTAPVVPGETMLLDLMIFDVGDGTYDSSVLLDDFRWDTNPAPVVTFID